MLPLGAPENEPTCGRPLGLRMHKGYLYVVDTYLGIFKVSVDTGNAGLFVLRVVKSVHYLHTP